MKILGLTGAVPLASRHIIDAAKSAFGGDDTNTATATGDTVELSAEARGKQALRIAELLQWSEEPIRVEDVRTRYDQNLAGLESRLTFAFAKAGIDTSVAFPLQTDAEGRVRVAGDHPQKAAIEQLFADDPNLRNDFVEVNAQADFLRAADEATAFQRAYAEDPEAALERFAHLFDPDRRPRFQLTVSGDKFDVGFIDSRRSATAAD